MTFSFSDLYILELKARHHCYSWNNCPCRELSCRNRFCRSIECDGSEFSDVQECTYTSGRRWPLNSYFRECTGFWYVNSEGYWYVHRVCKRSKGIEVTLQGERRRKRYRITQELSTTEPESSPRKEERKLDRGKYTVYYQLGSLRILFGAKRIHASRAGCSCSHREFR